MNGTPTFPNPKTKYSLKIKTLKSMKNKKVKDFEKLRNKIFIRKISYDLSNLISWNILLNEI